MIQIATSLLAFIIGAVAGFVDSTVGSGGLISIPMLVFIGLPPQVAIATDRLGSVGQTAGALISFLKAKKIRWKYVPVFCVFSLIGAIIGARILLILDPANLQRIIGVILLLVLPLVFLKKDLGIERDKVSTVKKLAGFATYFLIMIYNGFFGTGAGPFATYCFITLFGFTMIEASATDVLPWLLLSITSLVIFSQNSIVDYRIGISLFLGMTIGGYLGAHTLVKIGDVWVKRLFLVVVVISSVKLLFF